MNTYHQQNVFNIFKTFSLKNINEILPVQVRNVRQYGIMSEIVYISWGIASSFLLFCAMLLLIGMIRGYSWYELGLMLAALFISAIAQGLPVQLALILGYKIYQMAKHNILVKNIQVIETLSRVQALVIESAGILTRNELVVSHIFCEENNFIISGKGYDLQGSVLLNGHPVHADMYEDLHTLSRALCLLNEIPAIYLSVRRNFEVKDDSTQAALFVAAQKIGLNPGTLAQEYQKIYEIPFKTVHGYYAAFYEHQDQIVAFVIGTPESMMRRSAVSTLAMQTVEHYLHEGLRVVGVAKKVFKKNEILANDFPTLLETDLCFLGWCGLEDSLRPEAAYAITQARKAGLYIIMVTDDHQRTALSVAKEAGIFRKSDECIDGLELDLVSDAALKDMVRCTTVFSRVSLLQKVRIVQALQSCNLSVAMAGDAINNVPLLQAANVGISISGVQEPADIILLDSAFINILHAIEQGRSTIAMLKRLILYFFSTHLAEILIIVGTFVPGILYPEFTGLPFSPAQILLLNLIVDGFLNIGLCLEKEDKNLLFEKKWLGNKPIHLVDKELLIKAVWLALPMALGSFFIFLLYASISLTLARTMTLVTLVLFHVMSASLSLK